MRHVNEDNGVQFVVCWHGCTPTNGTMEPIANISQVFITRYWSLVWKQRAEGQRQKKGNVGLQGAHGTHCTSERIINDISTKYQLVPRGSTQLSMLWSEQKTYTISSQESVTERKCRKLLYTADCCTSAKTVNQGTVAYITVAHARISIGKVSKLQTVETPNEMSTIAVIYCMSEHRTVSLRHCWFARTINYASVAMHHFFCTGRGRARNLTAIQSSTPNL